MKGEFAQRVEAIVAQIPIGRIMTYGQLAALSGNSRAGRIVGGIAHFGDPNLPWHRVVNKKGGLATGYPGGRVQHQKHLENEGVEFQRRGGEILLDVETLIWKPRQSMTE